jgi:hypothetical protein
MRHFARLALVVATGVCAAGLVLLPAAQAQDQKNHQSQDQADPSSNGMGQHQPWGTWLMRVHLPTGGDIPFISTMNQEGTTVSSSSLMYGGLPGFPATWVSAVHDVWERSGPKTIKVTSFNLLFNLGTAPTAPGKLLGFVRSRVTMEFDGDGNHLVGVMDNEFLACPTPLTCPDINDPNAIWTPRLVAIPCTAVRLQRVEPGPLH